jgi:hypothetical protein
VLEDTSGQELFPGATVRLFPRMTHVALANRPEVYAAIDDWWPSATRPPRRWRRRAGAELGRTRTSRASHDDR